MTHPLVTQLWFARSEFVRGLQGVSAVDATKRLEPMNCIGWIIGHLASQEHYLWVELAQGKSIAPELHTIVGYGSPASTPPYDEMQATWQQVTASADDYLITITTETLSTYLKRGTETRHEDVGTSLLRNIYHYWFHLGEAHAMRQMLGHPDLPQFVGNMSTVRY
ncbi:MAG: DinB family protein [Anaerolineales bacterium]|jgi:uncharacterized damage-inducible protein DinB